MNCTLDIKATGKQGKQSNRTKPTQLFLFADNATCVDGSYLTFFYLKPNGISIPKLGLNLALVNNNAPVEVRLLYKKSEFKNINNSIFFRKERPEVKEVVIRMASRCTIVL